MTEPVYVLEWSRSRRGPWKVVCWMPSLCRAFGFEVPTGRRVKVVIKNEVGRLRKAASVLAGFEP